MSSRRQLSPARLRFYNLAMRALHALQGVAVLTLANDFTLPVVGTFMTGPPGVAAPPITPVFEASVAWGVALFLFVSAFVRWNAGRLSGRPTIKGIHH